MNIVDNRFEIWPSSPRNFATEPATWEAFRVAALALGTHDWQYEIDFLASESVTASALWHVSGYINTVNIYIVNSNYYAISLCKDGNSANNVSIVFRPLDHGGYGRHKIRVVKQGDVAVIYIDGDAAATFSGFGQYYLSAPPSAGFNSILFSVSLMDLTLQRNVWSYPSESERLRLITTNGNVIAGNQYFEAANPAVAARIDSQIDLRGRVSSYTVIVDFEAASFGGLASRKQELAGQGPAIASGGTYPICSMAYGGNPGGILQLSQEINGLRVPMARNIPILSGRHVAAATVEVNQAANNTTLSVYLDGVLVLTPGVYAGIPTGISTWTNFAINDNRSGAMTNQFGKIYAAALFNKALSAEQIAYLSS